MRWCALFLLPLTIAPERSPSQAPIPSCLIDEASKDSALRSVVARLRAALDAQDVAALKRISAARISVEQETKPFDEFARTHLQRDAPAWHDLQKIVRLGGRFETPDGFCMPTVVCNPSRDLDLDSIMIVGARVPAHVGPTRNSAVTAMLTCDVLRVPPDPSKADFKRGWVPVSLQNGRLAYVEDRYVRVDTTRIAIVRSGTSWVFSGYVGGD